MNLPGLVPYIQRCYRFKSELFPCFRLSCFFAAIFPVYRHCTVTANSNSKRNDFLLEYKKSYEFPMEIKYRTFICCAAFSLPVQGCLCVVLSWWNSWIEAHISSGENVTCKKARSRGKVSTPYFPLKIRFGSLIAENMHNYVNNNHMQFWADWLILFGHLHWPHSSNIVSNFINSKRENGISLFSKSQTAPWHKKIANHLMCYYLNG